MANKENKILKDVKQNQQKPPTASSQKYDDSEFPEVVKFLTSIKLMKYKTVFIENGFEDLDTILELNEEYLETLGIPLGHKLKIVKRIKQIADQNEGGGLQAKPPPQVLEDTNAAVSCSTESMANDTQIQQQEASVNNSISIQNNESVGMGTDPINDNDQYPDMCGVEVSQPNPSNQNTTDIQTNEISGEYQKVIESQPKQKAPKTVKFEEIKESKPTSSEVSIGTSEVAIDSMLDGCKIGRKESCWQCYKLQIVDDMFTIENMPNKLFCSSR